MKRIFISSTFRDFHKERDLLRNQVIPAVNQVARQYGEFVNICDLRWGVDTSENQDPEGKVLSVCLDEIDHSRPYMLVFLGERYGYVPGKERIRQEAEKRDLELEDLEISVTQLEIEYGALQDRDTLAHTWFYFREMAPNGCLQQLSDEEQRYREKLEYLKQRIKSLAGERVHFYRIGPERKADYETLCRVICQNLLDDFVEEWRRFSVMSPEEKEQHHQWNYLREKARHFQVGEAFARHVMGRLEISQNAKPFFVLTGDMGSGKSTCFSHICVEMAQKGWDVLPILCGSTALSTDEFLILRYVNWMLENTLGLPHMEQAEEAEGMERLTIEGEQEGFWGADPMAQIHRARQRLFQLCEHYEQTGRRMLLAVDAVDQLFGVQDIRDLLFLPQGKETHIRVLLTTTQQMHQMVEAEYAIMPALSESDKKEVLANVLHDNGKQLSAAVYGELLVKEAAANPLFLYLAGNHLCLMDEADYAWIGQFSDFMEGTNRRQLDIVRHFPDDLGQMAAQTLRKAADIMQSKAVARCIDYIAISRRGMRISDLERLLEQEGLQFVPLHFSQLIHYMQELYVLRWDGRYDYLHRALREGMLSTMQGAAGLHARVALHLLSLPAEDELRQQELYYHLLQAGMDEQYISAAAQAIGQHLPEQAYAMEELCHQCMKDHGQWLLTLVRKCLPFGNIRLSPQERELADDMLTILYNFETERAQRFLESKDGLTEYHRILCALIEVLEQADQKQLEPDQWYHILSLGYSRAGENLKMMDQPQALAQAGEYYEKAIRIREMQMEKAQHTFHAMELAIAYQDKGDLLDEIGSKQAREGALVMYEAARELMQAVLAVEQDEGNWRNYALLCGRIGRIYHRQESQEALQKALDYYHEAEHILRKRMDAGARGEHPVDLSRILCAIARVYVVLDGNQNIRQALDKYQEACDLVMRANQRKYSPRCVDEMIAIHYQMAFAYTQLEEQQALLRALELYERGFQLAAEAFETRGRRENERDMISLCEGICMVSLRLGEKRYLERALSYAKIASEHAHAQMLADGTHKSSFLFAMALYHEGQIYEAMGTDEHLQQAEEAYRQSLHWMEQLEQTGYDHIRISGEHIRLLEQIGGMYEKAGGILNFQKALPYYEKALAQEEQFLHNYGSSSDRQRNFEISCNRLGSLLMGMKDAQSLERAEPYVRRALDIATELAQQMESDKYQWDLSFCYNLYASLLWQMDEGLEQVKGYYEKAFDIRKQLHDKQATLHSKKTLSVSCEKLAQVYSAMSGYSDQLVALEYAKKQTKLCQEVWQQEDTLDSQIDLANAWQGLADQCFRLSGVQPERAREAETYYRKCLFLWEKILQQTTSYRLYMRCFNACGTAAHLAIYQEKYEQAEGYFDKLLHLAGEFLHTQTEDQYRLLLPDIYMEIAEYYESREGAEYQEKCLMLYQNALEVYESVKRQPDNDVHLSNMASISYSIAGVLMNLHRYEEAIHYFERSIAWTLDIPEQERTQQRTICLYSCYNRIGVMYLEKRDMERCVEYLQKAIACEEAALRNIRDRDATVEIMEDAARDLVLLMDVCKATERLELAEQSGEKAVHLLGILAETFDRDRAFQQKLIQTCIKLLYLKSSRQVPAGEAWPYFEMLVGLCKRHPEYQEHIHQLEKVFGIQVVQQTTEQEANNENLVDLYEQAEYYWMEGKTELGLQTSEDFLDMLEKVPQEQRSEQVAIYEYNTYSQMAAYYANQHTPESYRTAISLYHTAVEKATDAEKAVEESRKQEILRDIYEDCAHAILVSRRVEENQQAQEFFDSSIGALMALAKEDPDIYEILLARQAVEYAIFQLQIMRETEGVAQLLTMAYLLSQDHPELMELKEVIDEMLEEMQKRRNT